jgi:hypothetical protein
MDEREAFAALAALPDTPTITRHAVKPGDVIVLETDYPMTVEMAERIRTYAEMVWPNNRVAVLGDGLRVKVMTAEDLADGD